MEALRKHDLNLLQALTPLHLGSALTTGLISASLLSQWTGTMTPALASSSGSTHLESACPAPRPRGTVQTYLEPTMPLQGTTRCGRPQQRGAQPPISYLDLQEEDPPEDPRVMESQFATLLASPRSPPGTMICRFRAENMEDHRRRRWSWWKALSHVRIYVKEQYQFTQHVNNARGRPTVPNATSSGNPGQEVARCLHGTIT